MAKACMKSLLFWWLVFHDCCLSSCNGWVGEVDISRRSIFSGIFGTCAAAWASGSKSAEAAGSAVQDSVDVESFLRTGIDSGGPMGVSSQAGKSKPETGIVLRDGIDVLRDPRSGDVSAEILVRSNSGEDMAVLTSYSSPWPLATGNYFDVECRDSRTGDGAFLSVTPDVGGKSLDQLSDSFFLDAFMAPTGRFSAYGQPTDVKVKKSETKGNYRVIDLSFSTLAQSTQTEIPRRAQMVATIPSGSVQAIVLTASATVSRWNKGSNKLVASTVESFRAVPAPKTSMKLRRKERGPSLIE